MSTVNRNPTRRDTGVIIDYFGHPTLNPVHGGGAAGVGALGQHPPRPGEHPINSEYKITLITDVNRIALRFQDARGIKDITCLS